MRYSSSNSILNFYPIVATLAGLMLVPSAIAQEQLVTVTVDTTSVVRANNRHLMGHNLSFVEKAFGTWDSDLGEFEDTFRNALIEAAPGMLRFPGGNWTYGYHFNLARQGIAHRINFSSTPAQDFRPQHFLKLIHDLKNQGIESTPLIHPSAQFVSAEEAAAWVAYMIAPDDHNCRTIGTDSWEEEKNGIDVNWHDTCYWGQQREIDGAPRYTGTLYVQLGNEEWIKSCNNCSGMTDYYGITRHMRAMTIQQETGIPDQVTAYWPKYKALWAMLRGPNGLFTANEVKVGALGYAGISDPRGQQDRSLNNDDGWNQVLLTKISNNTASDLDFLTLHTYMYDTNGWEVHSEIDQRHNLLASHDHLRARIEQIRNQVSPALSRPIYITEYNTHLHPGTINPPRNIPASSLIAALHMVNWTAEAMYNDDIGGLVRWQTVTKKYKADNSGGHALFVSEDTNTDPSLWKMSSFYAAKLLAALHPKVVGVTVSDHASFAPSGFSPESWTWWEGYDPYTKVGPEIPFLTAAATLSADGSELALLLLNRNTVDGYNVSLDLGSFTSDNSYSRIELDSFYPDQGHDDIFDENTYGTATVEQIVLQEESFNDAFDGTIYIWPHQAVVIKLRATAQTTPNILPVASFTYSCTHLSCNFTDTSTDSDGSINLWSWDFEDGNNASNQNPSHTYAAGGTYSVELTVTDDDGDTHAVRQDVTVSEPQVADIIYVSSTSGGNAGGVSFADEDILAYDTGTNTWSMYFDGSDVGLSGSGKRDTDAFYLMADGSILLSTNGATTLPDVGNIDDSDIIRFIPSTLGTDSSGSFEMYFDGSDVGLSSNGEDLDAIGFAPDGRLLISTVGSFKVPGVSGKDTDLFAFSPTGLGANTSGTWSMYFDGSDVGLSNHSDEEIRGTWVDSASGEVYLATRGAFNVSGVSGDGADIFICNPSSLEASTSCVFSSYWDGSANDYAGEHIDGFAIKK